MKKKLALLLALVMILSLVPMSAFAAQGNRFASTFEVDKTSFVADNTDFVKATVYIANAAGPQGGEEVLLVTNRGGIDTFAWAADYGAGADPVTTASGKVVAELKTIVKGSAKLAAAVSYDSYGAPADLFADIAAHKAAVTNFLNGSTAFTADQLMIIGTYDVVATTASAGNVVLSADPGPTVANGLTQKTITVTVRSGSAAGTGSPVSGEQVTFTANRTGLTFDKATYTTDAFGRVTAKITATKAGTYGIIARAGGKNSAQVNYVFAADTTPFNIELAKNADGKIVATGQVADKILGVKVTDLNGNAINGDADGNGTVTAAEAAAVLTATVEDKPDGASAVLTFDSYSSSSDQFRYDLNPSKAGDYKIRFQLANGRFVDGIVKADKQGDIVKITIKYDEASLVIPSAGANSTAAPTVDQVDAKGVSTGASGILQFSSSNPAVATVNAAGVITTATTDAKDAQGVTITVIDTTNNLVATTVMPLVGAPVAIKASTPEPVQVNQDATIELTFVDSNGKVVALGASAPLAANLEHTILSKPDGAGVDVSYKSTAVTDFRDTGKSTLKVSSTKNGEVVVQVRITAGGNVYTTPVTVKVAPPAPPKAVFGAKDLTLTIGATVAVADGKVVMSDLAAFIKDGRTFVPVRFIAEQLGAEVSFTTNAEGRTETVTLTRPDLTVTMTMGSSSVVVVKNGVSSTVTADVAAYVVPESGRTVLPFRALAEAMGATVSFGPEGGMVEWVKFVQ